MKIYFKFFWKLNLVPVFLLKYSWIKLLFCRVLMTVKTWWFCLDPHGVIFEFWSVVWWVGAGGAKFWWYAAVAVDCYCLVFCGSELFCCLLWQIRWKTRPAYTIDQMLSLNLSFKSVNGPAILDGPKIMLKNIGGQYLPQFADNRGLCADWAWFLVFLSWFCCVFTVLGASWGKKQALLWAWTGKCDNKGLIG